MRGVKKRILTGLLLLLFCGNVFGSAISLSDLWNPSLFLSCVNFEIVGVCVQMTWHGPETGLEIRHWIPELLVETVKKPGDSVMPVVADVVNNIATQALKSLIGVTASSGSQGMAGRENIQFNEVHVYDFPFKNFLFCYFSGFWCCDDVFDFGSQGFFKYFSELDALEWRAGRMETLLHLPQIGLNLLCIAPSSPGNICMGIWGPIYPRTGFLNNQSEVVGSAADVFRAVSNDWIGSAAHVKITPILWQPNTADKIMFLYPHPSGCIKIGTSPLSWETGKRGLDGKYLYLYWRQVECCIF